jgi:hypothetical protein
MVVAQFSISGADRVDMLLLSLLLQEVLQRDNRLPHAMYTFLNYLVRSFPC